VLSYRPRNERAGFAPPAGMRLPQLEPRGGAAGGADIYGLVAGFDAAVTFDDLALFKEWSGLPIVVKGVVRGDDAVRCIDAGADAIAVSNHGGRQLDGCTATARALPEVVDAVAGRAEVYVDGGLRDGTDVLKAIALGAQAVMVGRPVMWGLATGGADGVRSVLDGLQRGLARAMAFCGAADVAALTTDLVHEWVP
jgi:4-hydroxymandelate oxidase